MTIEKDGYKNHYTMKQNRLKKLQETKSLCEVCGDKANTIHHKDGTNYNHDIDNLIVVCNRCHRIIESGIRLKREREFKAKLDDMRSRFIGALGTGRIGSKFSRMYGFTLKELSKIFKCSPSTVYVAIKRNNPSFMAALNKLSQNNNYTKVC